MDPEQAKRIFDKCDKVWYFITIETMYFATNVTRNSEKCDKVFFDKSDKVWYFVTIETRYFILF